VPRCECNDCKAELQSQEVYVREKFSGYHAIVPSEQLELSEHQYMLMSSHMYAFVLKDRRYGMSIGANMRMIADSYTDLVEVAGLEQPEMADTAIDSLVMHDVNKGLIKAVAQTYIDGKQSDRFHADFIHGKGEGQIILLHGPPGTGKTLTAGIECQSLQEINELRDSRICCRVHEASTPQHRRSRPRT